MAVYLDDSRKPVGCYVLSTLIADSDKELQDFAARIGLDGAWLLIRPESTDSCARVSPGLALRALRFGKAVPITADECLAMRWHRHHYGELGTPAAALERFKREFNKDTTRGTP